MLEDENKQILFEHPPTQDELQKTFAELQEADPTSIHYNRKIERPNLHIIRTLVYMLVVIAISFLIAYLSWLHFKNIAIAILFGCCFLLIICIIFIKHIFIWFVKAYQRFAPESVRKRCRFEPSCSQYMLLAIEKYGFLKGLKKGLNRWRRCKPPNGGVDYP